MLKKLPKIIIILFLSIFIVQLICLAYLLLAPKIGQAALEFKPEVPIPGFSYDSSAMTTKNIAELVKAVYKYAIGIIGILAAVVLMLGGVLWITAGGNQERVGDAKSWIAASLTGLVLALSSYLILATVNPALVDLKLTDIGTVASIKTGCCEKPKSGFDGCSITKLEECSEGWHAGAEYRCNSDKNCVLPLSYGKTIDKAGTSECENKFNGRCRTQCFYDYEENIGWCNNKEECCKVKSTTKFCNDLGKDYSCVSSGTCVGSSRKKVYATCPSSQTSTNNECCKICNDINAGCTVSGKCCAGLECVKPAGNLLQKVCRPLPPT